MKRVWVAALGLFLMLGAGCRRPEPIETRVNAETPQEFFAWQERNRPRLPESVAEEFDAAIDRLVKFSPAKMKLDDPGMRRSRFHPICRAIDGRSLREVMLLGYEAENTELLRTIILNSESLTAIVQLPQAVEGTRQQQRAIESMVSRRSANLEAARAQVESNRKRSAELRQMTPAERPDIFMRFALWRLVMLFFV
jgi:hypothetical protein